MDIELIETFLNVVESRNISAAARQMFTTQSTVSKRLQQLEEELQVPLLIRQKGQRNIELTSYGNEFVPLAQQWISLSKDFQNIKYGNNRLQLTVGANTLSSMFSLVPFNRHYVRSHPEVCLFIDNYHSSELYARLDKHSVDIAYVLGSRNYPDIIQTPLYREPMCLLCHKDSPYTDRFPLSELRAEDEIYLRWDANFELWHEQYWPNNRYRMRITMASMLANYLTDPQFWTIVPASTIDTFQALYPMKSCILESEPPQRTCYQLEHRYPRPSRIPVIEQWKNELYTFIREEAGSSGLIPLI